jgi:hypothetical protein
MPRIFLLQQHLQSWQQELELDSGTAALKHGGDGDRGSSATGLCDQSRNLFWREKCVSSYQLSIDEEDDNVNDSVEEMQKDDIGVTTSAAFDVIGKFSLLQVSMPCD